MAGDGADVRHGNGRWLGTTSVEQALPFGAEALTVEFPVGGAPFDNFFVGEVRGVKHVNATTRRDHEEFEAGFSLATSMEKVDDSLPAEEPFGVLLAEHLKNSKDWNTPIFVTDGVPVPENPGHFLADVGATRVRSRCNGEGNPSTDLLRLFLDFWNRVVGVGAGQFVSRVISKSCKMFTHNLKKYVNK